MHSPDQPVHSLDTSTHQIVSFNPEQPINSRQVSPSSSLHLHPQHHQPQSSPPATSQSAPYPQATASTHHSGRRSHWRCSHRARAAIAIAIVRLSCSLAQRVGAGGCLRRRPGLRLLLLLLWACGGAFRFVFSGFVFVCVAMGDMIGYEMLSSELIVC